MKSLCEGSNLSFPTKIYLNDCSQPKRETVYGTGAQTKFGGKNITRIFAICYHLLNFEIIFSWLSVRKSPSSWSVSYCFCLLLEVFSHSKLLYGLDKKNLDNTPDLRCDSNQCRIFPSLRSCFKRKYEFLTFATRWYKVKSESKVIWYL